jgi:arylsulfatase
MQRKRQSPHVWYLVGGMENAPTTGQMSGAHLVCSLGMAEPSSSASGSGLNLLVVMADQQRTDSMPCYGLDFVRTPNIDRLAREGVVFDRCYTPSPVCVAARAAFMTGQWPSTTGVLGNATHLDFDAVYPLVPSWPRRIAESGRMTAAIGKMHFYPFDARYGFRERISCEDKRHVYLRDDFVKFLHLHGLERVHPTENPGYAESCGAPVTPLPKRFHCDAYIGDQAADWLRRRGGEPFAAWVSFPGPHDPYDPPEEMAALYDDAPIPPPIGSADELAAKPRAQRRAGAEFADNVMFQLDYSCATPEQIRRWRAHYYANITLIDEGVGKILAALEETGALDRTVIVYCSDHGDALGDHGLPFKSFFYESMARVPLIVRGPGVAAGRRCGALVSLLDVVPLIYRTCGVEPPRTLEGLDLTPLLRDPSGSIRDSVVSEIQGRVMVRDDRFKYAHYEDGDAELYDLAADPTEERNLVGDPSYQSDIARLRGLLVEHALRRAASHAARNAKPPEPERAALDRAFREGRIGARRSGRAPAG